jgi:hypothetical protein
MQALCENVMQNNKVIWKGAREENYVNEMFPRNVNELLNFEMTVVTMCTT